MVRKQVIILFLLFVSSIYSQEQYSLRLDFVKSLFGTYPFEFEYEKNEKDSWGIGILYHNTDTMLILRDENSNTNGFVLSPFYRHYTRSNSESSSFYQVSLRVFNYVGFTNRDRKRRNLISLDFAYGYQFKISERLFLEPSIGLGAFRKLDEGNKFFLTPYLLPNFNVSIKF